MLDILQLHRLEDNRDARCWILANGKDLRKQIDYLQFKLLENMERNDFVNQLSERAGVKLKIRLNGLSIKEWLSRIKCLREGSGLSSKRMERITRTSGGDWIRIQNGEHLPSCKKLNRITNTLGLKVERVCGSDDFCLRSIDTIIKSLTSNWVPLVVVSGILDIYKEKFQIQDNKFNEIKTRIVDSIQYLRVLQNNSKPINAVKEVSEDLAKILGAFAADGNYTPPDMIRWEEEHKDNLDALSKWFENSVNLKLRIKPENRGKRSFVTKFRNKVIGRYFEIFFGFQPTDKRYTVDEPKLIKKQSLKIRKSFAAGALMFDGSVNSDGGVSFSSVSKKFRDSVSDILLEDGIKLSVQKKPVKFKKHTRFGKTDVWRFCSSHELSLNQLKKLSLYFDEGTFKRKILDFYLSEFKISRINDLRLLFPKIRNKLHPADLVNIIINLERFDVYRLIRQTNSSRATILRYLRILEAADLIKSEIREGKRIYALNNCSTNFVLLKSIRSECS